MAVEHVAGGMATGFVTSRLVEEPELGRVECEWLGARVQGVGLGERSGGGQVRLGTVNREAAAHVAEFTNTTLDITRRL